MTTSLTKRQSDSLTTASNATESLALYEGPNDEDFGRIATDEERLHAITQVAVLTGAILTDELMLGLVFATRGLTVANLKEIAQKLPKDHTLQQAIRFGDTLRVADLTRVLEGSKLYTYSEAIETWNRHPVGNGFADMFQHVHLDSETVRYRRK